MDSFAYIVGSCVVAALAGSVALFKRRRMWAVSLALAGPLLVLIMPIVLSWIVGPDAPGVALVWLYAGPTALGYLVVASAFSFLLRGSAPQQYGSER